MLALLAAALLAQAGPPGPAGPPPVPAGERGQRFEGDASPQSTACTFAAALSGDACTYEAEPHAAPDAKANAKLASDQAAKTCAAEARDEAQRTSCVALTVKAAAERCTGKGRGLADEQGRLTRAAQPCIIALRQVIARTTAAPKRPAPAAKHRNTP